VQRKIEEVGAVSCLEFLVVAIVELEAIAGNSGFIIENCSSIQEPGKNS
jgi:hypothetical protein